MESALKDSKKILSVTIDSGLQVVDSNLAFRKKFLECFQVSSGESKFSFRDTLEERSLGNWERLVSEQKNSGKNRVALLIHNLYDGEVGSIRHTLYYIHWETDGWTGNGSKKTLHLLGVDETISVQRKIKYNKQVKFQQTYIDSTKSLIFMKDLEGRYVGLNSTMERLLKKSRKEILGKTDQDLLNEEIGSMIRESEMQVLSSLQTHPTIERFNNHSIYEFYRFPIFQEGLLIGLGGIGVDVTLQVESQINLSHKIEENKAIISAIPDLVFIIDSDYRFLDFNSNDENELLYSSGYFLGKTIFECLPPDLAKKTERMMSMARYEQKLQMIEYSLMMPGGKRFYEARCVYYANDRYLVVVRNITEDKIKKIDLQNDLDMARDLQYSTLPKASSLNHDHLGMSIVYKPFSNVSGDIYDFYEVQKNYFRFVLVDAVGHGIQSSLLTMAIRTELERVKFSRLLSPSELLNLLNNSLISTFKNRENTCTAIILDIDFASQKIKYSSGGHPNQFMRLRKNPIENFGLDKSPLIGMVNDFSYEECVLPWDDKFEFFLFTDGAFDFFDKSNQIFGLEEFMDTAHKLSRSWENIQDKNSLSSELYTSILNIAQGDSLRDDLTLMHIYSK